MLGNFVLTNSDAYRQDKARAVSIRHTLKPECSLPTGCMSTTAVPDSRNPSDIPPRPLLIQCCTFSLRHSGDNHIFHLLLCRPSSCRPGIAPARVFLRGRTSPQDTDHLMAKSHWGNLYQEWHTSSPGCTGILLRNHPLFGPLCNIYPPDNRHSQQELKD